MAAVGIVVYACVPLFKFEGHSWQPVWYEQQRYYVCVCVGWHVLYVYMLCVCVCVCVCELLCVADTWIHMYPGMWAAQYPCMVVTAFRAEGIP